MVRPLVGVAGRELNQDLVQGLLGLAPDPDHEVPEVIEVTTERAQLDQELAVHDLAVFVDDFGVNPLFTLRVVDAGHVEEDATHVLAGPNDPRLRILGLEDAGAALHGFLGLGVDLGPDRVVLLDDFGVVPVRDRPVAVAADLNDLGLIVSVTLRACHVRAHRAATAPLVGGLVLRERAPGESLADNDALDLRVAVRDHGAIGLLEVPAESTVLDVLALDLRLVDHRDLRGELLVAAASAAFARGVLQGVEFSGHSRAHVAHVS